MTDTPPDPAPRKNRNRWQARNPLTQDEARRQGDVTRCALLTLGNKDAAIAYLNEDRDDLGGRPIDLALATAEGFRRVVAHLADLPAPSPAIG